MRRKFHVALFHCLTLAVLAAGAARGEEWTVERTDRRATVKLDGQVFTEYLVRSGNKPVLWPIIGPTGKPVTRVYPLADAPGEKQDHVHHRSLWFTHGSVNGTSFWEESKSAGTIAHRKFAAAVGGEEARIVTENDWLDAAGKRICTDVRTLKFSADAESRVIDYAIVVTASDGKLTFGDTKEGTFGVRVAETVKVEANQGGRIVNSRGETDDKAWGRRAEWVDYHGPIDGATVGIAILNHPSSFRFPTYWHVRTYGLFAANPFGVHDFQPSEPGDGAHTLAEGETMLLAYRVIVHKGDEKSAAIADRFAAYAQSPRPDVN